MRRLLWAVLGVLLLSALAWQGVPALLRWQGPKIAAEQLGRALQVGQVRFNPWTLELTIDDLALAGAAGAPPQLAVQRVYADAAWASIWRLAPVVDGLRIDAPVLRLAHSGDGHYDFDDILARLAARPPAPEAGKPARFALYNIDIQDGRVEFDDQAVGRVHQVTGLKLALPFVSSLPAAREVKVQPQLAFELNGGRFDSQAQALPFDDSRRTEATLRLQAQDLQPYLGYLPAGLPLRLQAAVLDADLRLRFEQAPAQSLRLDGTLALHGLKATDAQGEQALAFDTLSVQLAEVRPLEGVAHLASVELQGPQLTLRRDAQGGFNIGPPNASNSGAASAGLESAEDTFHAKDSGTGEGSGSAGKATPSPSAPGFALRIDALAVRDGAVDFRDESTAGDHADAAALRLSALALQASEIAYPLEQPLKFQGTAALADAAAKSKGQGDAGAASLSFEGQASRQQAEAQVHLAAAPLALAAPYLASHLVPRLDGVLDTRLRLHWSDAVGAEPDLQVVAERLTLSKLALSAEAAGAPAARARGADRAAPLPRIERVEVADARVDLRTRAIEVGEVRVQSPQLTIEREPDGRWAAGHWLREAQALAAPEAPPAGPAWALRLDALAVSGATVGWIDRVPARAVRAELTQLEARVRQFELGGTQPVQVEWVTRLGSGRRSGGEPGRLSWRGTLTQGPQLAAEGDVTAERLPAHAFVPYVADLLNVDVLRADTSFKGHVRFAETEQGPRLRAQGDARVEELRTYSRAAGSGATADAGAAGDAAASPAALAPVAQAAGGSLGEELASWKQLRLSGLDVQVAPDAAPQVSVGATRLSDFFVRLVIHPNGRLNLQDVVKSAASEAAASASAPAAAEGVQPAAGEFSAVASDSGAASARQSSAKAENHSETDGPAPVLHFGPTELVNGHVDFADHFIRPNYSADLSALTGTLGAFASVAPAGAPQMAELKLTGRAEGTAQLDVAGRLNPLADPLALDIRAQVTDLDLPPLSPYAVKYAGHGIERGKLGMDVTYRIQPDGQLSATNKLVLNQLQFGEPVDGAPASLPVQLATALLSDSNGVIDLDLPISGSLNDPQFSLGPVIFKAIVNLIGKAITAPFSLLAQALGGADGQDMSRIAFAPGSARLDAPARAQLDQLAKALADRPQLKLTVAGHADLDTEREGYRRQRLHALVAAEQRSEAPASGPASGAAVDASESGAGRALPESAAGPLDAENESLENDDVAASAQYPLLLRRLYRRADIPDRPRNALGMLRDVPVAEMEARLMAQIPVGGDTMRQLAVQRGVAVKDYLAGHGVLAARLFLGAAGAAGAVSPDKADGPPVPHAALSLGTR